LPIQGIFSVFLARPIRPWAGEYGLRRWLFGQEAEYAPAFFVVWAQQAAPLHVGGGR